MGGMDKVIDDSLLDAVSGGAAAGTDESVKKYNELKKIYDARKLAKKGVTTHQLQAACEKWAENGYKDSAEDIISSMA